MEKANDIPRLKRTDSRYINPRMPWTQVAFIVEMLKKKYQHYQRNISAISNAKSKRRINEVGGIKGEMPTRKQKWDSDGDREDLGVPARKRRKLVAKVNIILVVQVTPQGL